MRCSSCKRDNDASLTASDYCDFCGSVLGAEPEPSRVIPEMRACLVCGERNYDNDEFCDHCAAPLPALGRPVEPNHKRPGKKVRGSHPWSADEIARYGIRFCPVDQAQNFRLEVVCSRCGGPLPVAPPPPPKLDE
ncbi:MAG: zinc ribbon domain-containing protein [Deltaproteobacteria bacterium]|nr:zinc ribbon domain-containing protein [Deltaproteobacteria bacterium]